MRESRGERVARWIVLSFLAMFVLTPLFVMVSSALKPLRDVQDDFTWLPSTLTFQAFVDMWSTVPLGNYLRNSVVVASVAALFSVSIAVFAAFAISRYRFRGRGVFSVAVLSTQMFPGILFLLPLFLIYVNLGTATGLELYQTRLGLVITYLTFSLPFSIWMLVGYFDSIPRGLDEAAQVDGAGSMRTLFTVILPTAVPGIVAVTVYAFMTAWGEVLFASIMTDQDSRTLAVGLQAYSTQFQVYWNQVMAASLVVSVPVVAGFLALQRYFVAGLTAGAVK
ncbi:carbohydrate ABC transporter permease [Dactylosporangium aurantiacum]|uniref:Carbohydrate ABC transporter permease n=1 Tax=Dactylosporangium aurantiacum TaxID=35754 RepID=A0A9Q9MFY3_9ACTN|nr:carbohydrate ABC transporter permease [Dactylosporangium aurantiacum]MDG6102599.1 carbohydrate ABC transporter permease [Dactylosporangium aurantiacum]UWZ53140.1 carbohydrate ABC transporter permease [Dactylosporangium aurantiacum]